MALGALVLCAGLALVTSSASGPGLELHPEVETLRSEEAETTVVGAFFAARPSDEEALDHTVASLDPSMFTRRDLGLVFKAARRLRGRGEPIDVTTVAEELKGQAHFEEIGGYDLLSQLVDAVPSAANVECHAKIVRDRAVRRQLRSDLRGSLDDISRIDRPLDEVVTEARARLDGVGLLNAEEATPPFVLLSELLKNPEMLEPTECVVARLAYRGRLVVLNGPDKSGKSTLLAHATVKLSQGRPFLDGPVSSRNGCTVHVGLEEAVQDAVRRFSALGAAADRIQLVSPGPSNLLQRLDALFEEWPTDLVVVDSLTEYARLTAGAVPDDGDSAGWAAVMRPLVQVARRRDVAIVVLHHVRQSDGEWRGSTEIPAAADVMLTLKMPKSGEDPTLRRITGRGRWQVAPFSIALRDGRYILSGGAELSLDTRVLLHVESNPGASKKSTRKVVGGRGTAVDAALNRLVTRGAVQQRQGRFYVPCDRQEMAEL